MFPFKYHFYPFWCQVTTAEKIPSQYFQDRLSYIGKMRAFKEQSMYIVYICFRLLAVSQYFLPFLLKGFMIYSPKGKCYINPIS